jgi:hypothetical protein
MISSNIWLELELQNKKPRRNLKTAVETSFCSGAQTHPQTELEFGTPIPGKDLHEMLETGRLGSRKRPEDSQSGQRIDTADKVLICLF